MLNDIFHIIHKSFVLNTSVCSNFSFILTVTNMHFKSLHGIYSFVSMVTVRLIPQIWKSPFILKIVSWQDCLGSESCN